MPDNAARTHTQASNRAKDRGERKVVFKGVLDNPFRIPWPSVPLSVQNTALKYCLSELEGIAGYRRDRKRRHRLEEKSRKKQKVTDASAETRATEPAETQPMPCDYPLTDNNECPPILQHLVIGINEVTRRMESQIMRKRFTALTTKNDPSRQPSSPPLQLILVCRSDTNPTILVDHIPHLVAAYNSLQPQVSVILVPLSAGAELLISKAIGFRNAAVLGIDSNYPNLTNFTELLDSVPILTASWLASSIATDKFVPTYIKQTRTSAPKDMRADKQRRKAEKKSKKQLQKSSKSQSSTFE